MKIFIVLLAVASTAVNAQLDSDVFDSYLLNNFNVLQNTQPDYRNYEYYQTPTKNRVSYIPILRNPGPTTFPNYKSTSIGPETYIPYELSGLLRRPNIPVVTTVAPTTVPVYNSPYITPKSYNPHAISTTTSRPFIPVVSTQAITGVPAYTNPQPHVAHQNLIIPRRPNLSVISSPSPSILTPSVGPETLNSYEALTSTIRPDLNVVPTIAPSFKTLYGGRPPFRRYRILTRRRPYIPNVTTPVPTSIPIYNDPTESYRSDQTLITTSRPYIPTISTPVPTTIPVYNAPFTATPSPNILSVTTPAPTIVPNFSPTSIASNRPYETLITSRPFTPTLTSPAATIVPTYITPSIDTAPYNLYQTSSTIRPPYIPYVSTTPIPYGEPTFVVSPIKFNYDDGSANTIRSENEVNRDGSYNWSFETDNGIAAQAQGALKITENSPNRVANVVRGAFSWIAPGGELVSVTYIADETGYHPQVKVIPASPPISPLASLRSLDYIGAAKK